jgi:NAD(P)-dependent dehydrogenase (short-subunit alcohol dehydrogenase family)
MAERLVVVVTGASGGVGRAVAREFAKHGAAVGLIARGKAGLDAAARDVSDLGGVPFAYQADVADFDAVNAAAGTIEERLGPIDIWINNTMTTVFAFLDDVDPHEFERATRVTYLGAVWGTKAALARMMPRHPMPVPPIYEPEVAARAVYWSAHHRRRELYVGFPTVYTILGNKLAPWLAERYLARTAVDGQQTDQRFDGAAAANLFEPVDADHDEGSRGIFDDQSHRRSEQAWLSRQRLGSGLAAAAVAGGAAALLTRRRA